MGYMNSNRLTRCFTDIYNHRTLLLYTSLMTCIEYNNNNNNNNNSISIFFFKLNIQMVLKFCYSNEN